MIARLVSLLEAAVESVVNAAVDAITAAWVEAERAPAHIHGAWCHPSADGCPDRPGM